MPKIYFACSIRGGRDDAAWYADLAKHIANQAQLLSEIFADQSLTDSGMDKPSEDIWQQDISWVKEAQAIIAEVTNPSLGVGYEIAKAEEWNKPVLALFRKNSSRSLSAMIEGPPACTVVYYETLSDAQIAIDQFIASLHNR